MFVPIVFSASIGISILPQLVEKAKAMGAVVIATLSDNDIFSTTIELSNTSITSGGIIFDPRNGGSDNSKLCAIDLSAPLTGIAMENLKTIECFHNESADAYWSIESDIFTIFDDTILSFVKGKRLSSAIKTNADTNETVVNGEVIPVVFRNLLEHTLAAGDSVVVGTSSLDETFASEDDVYLIDARDAVIEENSNHQVNVYTNNGGTRAMAWDPKADSLHLLNSEQPIRYIHPEMKLGGCAWYIVKSGDGGLVLVIKSSEIVDLVKKDIGSLANVSVVVSDDEKAVSGDLATGVADEGHIIDPIIGDGTQSSQIPEAGEAPSDVNSPVRGD